MDIKPINILIVTKSNNYSNNKYILKLADFGESRQSENTLANTNVRGTVCYMSPELLLIYSKSGFG